MQDREANPSTILHIGPERKLNALSSDLRTGHNTKLLGIKLSGKQLKFFM